MCNKISSLKTYLTISQSKKLKLNIIRALAFGQGFFCVLESDFFNQNVEKHICESTFT